MRGRISRHAIILTMVDAIQNISQDSLRTAGKRIKEESNKGLTPKLQRANEYYLELLNKQKINPITFSYLHMAPEIDQKNQEAKYLNRTGNPGLTDQFKERFSGFNIPNFLLDMLDEVKEKKGSEALYSSLSGDLMTAVKNKDYIAVPWHHESGNEKQLKKIIKTVAQSNPDKTVILALECTSSNNYIELVNNIALLLSELESKKLESTDEIKATLKSIESFIKKNEFLINLLKDIYQEGDEIKLEPIDKAYSYSPNGIEDLYHEENIYDYSSITETFTQKSKQDLEESPNAVLNLLDETVSSSIKYHDFHLGHRNMLQISDVSAFKAQHPNSVIIHLFGNAHKDMIPILTELNGNNKSIVIPVEHQDSENKDFLKYEKYQEAEDSPNKLINLHQGIFHNKPIIKTRIGDKEINLNDYFKRENSEEQWEKFKSNFLNNFNSADETKNVMDIVTESLNQTLIEIIDK